MGSVDQIPPTYGTFSVAILDDIPQSDPATRPYLVPPPLGELQQRKFPLVNFRDQVFHSPSGGDYTQDRTFLDKHGFTAVRHSSKTVSSPSDFEDEEKKNAYYSEVEDLVKRVTGCKEVILTTSVCRGGKPPAKPEDHIAFKGFLNTKEQVRELSTLSHRSAMMPIRFPHCDDALAGGRQYIRAGMIPLREAASNAGVIEREDEICSIAGMDARERESNAVLDEKYNDHENGKLGPRYAGFSIWRPLRMATRDPLALVRWSDVERDQNHVAWPYDNRWQGPDGDWTKELAMFKVKPEAAAKGDVEEELKFWYVSEQEPDEVLFVKMFDTASLGDGATVENGCLHGSPDLGSAGYGEERQSVEVRCYAFW